MSNISVVLINFKVETEPNFWGGTVTLVYLASLVSLPVISLIMFPFYVNVTMKNRKRDRNTAIFPLTDYFFKLTFITESLSIIGLLLTVGVLLVFKDISYNDQKFKFPLSFYWVILVCVKMNFTVVLDILTAYLAIHRFLLYFSPKIGNFVSLTGKKAKFLMLSLHILALLSVFHSIPPSGPVSNEDRKRQEHQMQIAHLSLNLLVLFGSLPYFLMLLSIRKLTNLSSNATFQPELYIKYQIVIIVISKLLLVPILIKSSESQSPFVSNTVPLPLACLMGESFMVPVIMQTAYLLSSKTNLDTLKSSICCWKSIEGMISGKGNTVEPSRTAYITPGVAETTL